MQKGSKLLEKSQGESFHQIYVRVVKFSNVAIH